MSYSQPQYTVHSEDWMTEFGLFSRSNEETVHSLTLQIQGNSWLGKTCWIDGLLHCIWKALEVVVPSYSQDFYCQVNDHCAIGILGYTKSNHKWLTVRNKLLQTNKLPYSQDFGYGNSIGILILYNFWHNEQTTLVETKY